MGCRVAAAATQAVAEAASAEAAAMRQTLTEEVVVQSVHLQTWSAVAVAWRMVMVQLRDMSPDRWSS